MQPCSPEDARKILVRIALRAAALNDGGTTTLTDLVRRVEAALAELTNAREAAIAAVHAARDEAMAHLDQHSLATTTQATPRDVAVGQGSAGLVSTGVAGAPATRSGARYAGVPISIPVRAP